MLRARGEVGQTLPLVALLVVAVGVGAVWIGRLGAAAGLRARASAAADMAALAGAVGERADAELVAAANGARLVRFERVGGDTRVRVTVGRASASARARPAFVGSSTAGLAPGLRAAVRRAEQLLGRAVPVTSGRRTRAEQAALWANRAANPFPVARPGTSKHEHGLAVDVPLGFVTVLLRVAADAGLCRPYPATDPVHFELCPP